MSKPIRYTHNIKCVEPSSHAQNICSGMVECSIGEWVLHSDYARLKAEVERLKQAHSDALADFWAIHKGYFDLKAEVERLRASSFVTAVPVEQYEKLKAEVERLESRDVVRTTAIAGLHQTIRERDADVERLRKAGDAVVAEAYLMANKSDWPYTFDILVEEWNAAKEGKEV